MSTRKPNLVASAVSLALASGALAVQAQQAASTPGQAEQALPKITVTETAPEEGYRPVEAQSPRFTRTLRDTPQTITVVPQQVMLDQNLLGLREVLSTLPGITFGAGEGGGGYGDSITLRGFNANNDIFTDGMRDSAQYTRSDSFNVEQVEVVNGPNSVFAGAGSVGGSINLASKVAGEEAFTNLLVGGGTDSYGRATVDTNVLVGDSTAVRLNAMVHQNDVPGRDYEKYERWGVAPSIIFGLGSDTTMSLAYVHQEDDNIPQYGVPFFVNANFGGPLPGVDPSNYYGYHNVDEQQIDIDSATAVLAHEFNERYSVRNQTRYQVVDQYAVVNPPQGTWCLDTSLTPAGVACTTPGYYQPSGPRGTTRDTTNRLLANQTDFRVLFDTGSIEHTLVAGFALTHETYHLLSGNSLRNAGGATPNPALPLMNIADPDSEWTGPVNFIVASETRGSLDNQAVYVFDALQFSPRWEFNAGLRYERNSGDTVTTTFATPATGGAATGGVPAENTDNLFSYRAGLVFKPVENGSIYLAFGNSETPSKATVNGSCVLTSTTGTANCFVEPEEAINYELGTKWDLFDARLSVTASIFRNDRTNYRVNDPGNPDNPSGEQALDGEARVDGVSLGVAGQITDKWLVFANYMYLDSEVLQSVSDYVKESTGIDAQAGNPLPQVPENSGSLWTTYELPMGFRVGYGYTYQGSVYLSSVAPLYSAPSYSLHRLMASWQATEKLGLQLNINNVTDEEYYIRARNNGWAVPGDTRQFVLSATYAF